jgi:hypothetical protein
VRLFRKIWKEEFNYYSDKSVDGLRMDIRKVLDESWDFSVNLTGKFASEYEFEMTPKFQLAIIKNFERDVSYLKGQIFGDLSKGTRVTFSVRPNSIFLIFSILFPLIGIFVLTVDTMDGSQDKSRSTALFFTFGVPVFMLLYGYFAKQAIKNRFIRTFDLKPIE